VATPIPVAVASSTRPAALLPPQVISFDEMAYTCKDKDTYSALSKAYYQTENYAAALQLYNRNHARASDTMRRDGALVPGDTIYLPPARILEERHGAVIPKKSGG
jgi:hypothetical protein